MNTVAPSAAALAVIASTSATLTIHGVWVVFILLIGFTLPNVNNWAHGVGYASGFAMGAFVWPRTTQQDDTLFRFAAGGSMLLTISTLIYGLLFS